LEAISFEGGTELPLKSVPFRKKRERAAPGEDLRSVQELVGRKWAENGPEPLSRDGALELWRLEFHEEQAETLEVIREGLEDMYVGRMRPVEEFDREFRERHGLLPRS
jgi:hypothetical protein